jgi:hypothetical protein
MRPSMPLRIGKALERSGTRIVAYYVLG